MSVDHARWNAGDDPERDVDERTLELLVEERAGTGSRLPSVPLGRWRLPVAVTTAAATAAVASAIALHTWGPDLASTPYTSAPLIAQGEAGGAGIWPQPVYVPSNGGPGRTGG